MTSAVNFPELPITIPKPGVAPTQLMPQMPSGTLIVNNSLTQSVWIGSDGGMTSGTGQKLGPKGQITWSLDRGTAYAIADSANTDTVSISVSSNMTNLVNPADVGAATALELATMGVPNTGIIKQLYNATGLGATIDVTGYASLICTLSCVAFGSTPKAGPIQFNWLDDVGNVVSTDVINFSDLSTLTTLIIPVLTNKVSIQIPTVIIPTRNYNIYTLVYGSNRTANAITAPSFGGIVRKSSIQAWGAGTTTLFATAGGYSATVVFVCSTTNQPRLLMTIADGTDIGIIPATTSPVLTPFQLDIPAGVVRFSVEFDSADSGLVELDLISRPS